MNEIISSNENNPLIPFERKGKIDQGFDKLGRPYRKIEDENGLFTKQEILKDGTEKLTVKRKP